MHDSAADMLGPDGPLARALADFRPRAAQQRMATAVETALGRRGTLIVEAGTGTGKTYAYLVPALRSGRKVLISTGTRNLQDQLFHRDLPRVRDALGIPIDVALLKGRGNYLCLQRLEQAELDGRGRAQAAELQLVRAWAGRTRQGDIAEMTQLPEDAPVWPQVTSTADNCLGSECPRYEDCHVLKARRAAQEAEVVVINHHLLFADLALKEEGFGELLPDADAFIIDEAHQLPEAATAFFGVSLTSRQLLDLARDAELAQRREAPEQSEIAATAQALERAVQDFRLSFGVEPRRGAWHEVATQRAVQRDLTALQEALQRLQDQLAALAERGKQLDQCQLRATQLGGRLAQVTAPDDTQVAWFETYPRAFAIHLTPLDIAPQFQARLQALPRTWVFTSATLAVGGQFEHFARRLGIENAETLCLDSPFDFARNALLYVPQSLPDPQSPDYTASVIEAALPVLAASRGRAFLLFTSHRALQEAARLLTGRIEYPLLVQGSMPRAALLECFRGHGDAVLLGTSSFWEGVDVRGEALSCVIIDKLPFASPGDPVLQARINALRTQGGNPFVDFQLPAAVIALKQGVGRLIRDVHDRGVLVLCDPRLYGKSYGKVFFKSLPPMPRTRMLTDVENFFAHDGVCEARAS